MIAPFIRIGLRYLSGFLIAKGLADAHIAGEFTSPELVGALVGIVNETWYYLARKYGWSK